MKWSSPRCRRRRSSTGRIPATISGVLTIFFKGRIARVRIFDRPISLDELARLIAHDRERKPYTRAVVTARTPKDDSCMKAKRQEPAVTPETPEDASPMNPDRSTEMNGVADTMRRPWTRRRRGRFP